MRKTPVKEFISRRYIKSLLFGCLLRTNFKSIKTYCMFIGYQRSGHSFIGALLDAHPHAIMGMEVDALNLVRLGYSRNQLFYCLIRNSEIFRKKLRNVWTGYSYAVPRQYQGKYLTLKLIGDKKGGKSTLRLAEDFSLYKDLLELVECRIKVLHVIRNPLDNISTMVIRNYPEGKIPIRADYIDKIEHYFYKVKVNDDLKKSGQLEIMDVYHEDLIAEPEKQLKNIIRFVDLEPFEDYLKTCSAIVYKKPHLSRDNLDWPDDLKEEVKQRAINYSFLKRYFITDEKKK